MPTKDEVLAGLQDELDAIVSRNREAFQGAHKEDLERLMGLSKEDLAAIIPGVTGAFVYAQLIDVVKEASAKNRSAADLKVRIEALGATAVAIAKEAGVLGGLLG